MERSAIFAVLFAIWFGLGDARAQTSHELKLALSAAASVSVKGPARASLGDGISFDIPEGMFLINGMPAIRILRALGQPWDSNTLAIVIMEAAKDGVSFAVISNHETGYIAEGTADRLNPDSMLLKVSRKIRQASTALESRGLPGLMVTTWAEQPTYDRAKRRLTMAPIVRPKGITARRARVEYGAFLLGRRGFITVSVPAPLNGMTEARRVAHAIADGIQFEPGRRYEDFDRMTDGLLALDITAVVEGVRR